jgi:hypothetical protein
MYKNYNKLSNQGEDGKQHVRNTRVSLSEFIYLPVSVKKYRWIGLFSPHLSVGAAIGLLPQRKKSLKSSSFPKKLNLSFFLPLLEIYRVIYP